MIMKQISVSGRTMELTILCLFGLLAFCQAGIFKLDPRIVNGEDAKEGEFPFQVSLQYKDKVHFCSGSIISKNYVITTSLCVDNEIKDSIQVAAGMTDLGTEKSLHLIERILPHNKFNASNPHINNIALLKVKPPFNKKQIIPLPSITDILKTGDKAVVSGWGKFSGDTGGPLTVRGKLVGLVSWEYLCASKIYPTVFTRVVKYLDWITSNAEMNEN